MLTKTVHLLNQRRHQKIALNFLALTIHLQEKQLFSLFEVGDAELPRQLELMRQYENLPMDFADAGSQAPAWEPANIIFWTGHKKALRISSKGLI